MKYCSLLLVPLALASCTPAQGPSLAQESSPVAVATTQSTLTASQRAAIGRKIWQNESGGSKTGLTAWNDGEDFPSLGIGHFIWYPAGREGRFTESFPQFVQFARRQGSNPPAVALQADCPWQSKASFQRDFNGSALSSLRDWLASNVNLQTDFIIAKSRASLPKILRAAGSDAQRVQANYNKVATTPQGQYALIDYVNFKGEGTNPSERYQGQGWGLLQVLQGMKNVPAGEAAANEFAASAKRVLANRVRNAPAARNEGRWLQGWHNRCNTYARPL